MSHRPPLESSQPNTEPLTTAPTGPIHLRQSSERAALWRILIALGIAAGLWVWAAWPIYRTPWTVVVVAVATALGVTLALLVKRLPVLTVIAAGALAALLGAIAVAVPSAWANLPESLGAEAINAIRAVVYGWKQLLTLELPVGTYQAMLVPLYLVALLAALAATLLRRSRWAAVALGAPVVWATVFGASAVSSPLTLGPVTLFAPREVTIWCLAAAGVMAWVWLTAGRARRITRGGGSGSWLARAGRGIIAAISVALAAAIALAALPVIHSEARTVPRDRIDPELVMNEQPSPLAAYRASKTDAQLERPWFTVTADGDLPARLRLVTLDSYNGVDFTAAQNTRFTRFPSGRGGQHTAPVTVTVNDYRGIWAPLAPPLVSTPEFHGPRAGRLADSFYLNRDTGNAVVVPTRAGLTRGDRYTARMTREPRPGERGEASALAKAGEPGRPRLVLDDYPELRKWLARHRDPDLGTMIHTLRQHGYLSHSLDDRGEWIRRAGVQFFAAPGGHSAARIETLFEQLNTTPNAVAAVGDDEQFATAAALLARASGYDSRVVMGVRLGHNRGVPGVPSCERVCRGEHLAAWIEVRGEDGDWVTIDASPQIQHPPATTRRGERLPEYPTVPDERHAQPVDPPPGLSDQSDVASDPPPDLRLATLQAVLRAAGLSLFGLLCVLVPLLCLPFAKHVRARSRRRAPDATARAVGAWNELRDRALDRGIALPLPGRGCGGDPLSELGGSRHAQAQYIGVAEAEEIAEAVSAAVYGPRRITLEEADRLWALLDELERQHPSTWLTRLRAAYRLRSLGIGKHTCKH